MTLTRSIFDIAADIFDPPPDPYVDKPVEWGKDKLGEFYWSVQRTVLESVRDHRRTAVRSSHGIGKSLIASRAAAWWLDAHPPGQDTASAVGLTGGPMLALSGDKIDSKVQVGPKRAIKLGKDGKATMLSGAEGISALDTHQDKQLARLSVNARVPEAKLGRIDPSKIDAGIIMTLSFGPLGSLVERKRLVRKPKYRLILKFKQRFDAKEAAATKQPVKEILDADLMFGSFLPSDVAGVIKNVTDLRNAKPPLISRRTAMKMLQEVGVPIEDISEEEAEIDVNR